MTATDARTHAPPLLSSLPESAEAPVIRVGGAQLATVDALERFLAAFLHLEATAMAVARALDATAAKETT
jgi:hypothetical protein